MSVIVPVELGERSYQIHIGQGLLEQAGALLTAGLAKPVAQRVPVVTDQTVARLHYDRLAASLRAAGLEPVSIVMPAGEQT